MERKNCSKQTLYHLKRIGPTPNRPRVVNVMDFYKVTSLIGRNGLQVDFYIDSNEKMQSHMISRCHARVVRQPNNDHKLFDDSLNGIFVNHIKIRGSVILCEGDRVTFGHPVGRDIPFGTWERQVNNHHQFIFEKCCCEPKSTIKKSPKKRKFVIPKKTSPRNLAAKRERNQTRTFTQADIQNLKEKSEALFPTCPKEDRSSSISGTKISENSEKLSVGIVEASGSTPTVQSSEAPESLISETPKQTEEVEIPENSGSLIVVDIPENVRTTEDVSDIHRASTNLSDITRTNGISNIPTADSDMEETPIADTTNISRSDNDILDIPRKDFDNLHIPSADISDIPITTTDGDILDIPRPNADISDIFGTDAEILDTLRADAVTCDIPSSVADISKYPSTDADILDPPRAVSDIPDAPRTTTVDEISEALELNEDFEVSDDLRATAYNDNLDIPRITTSDEISDICRHSADDVNSDNLQTTTHEKMEGKSSVDTFLNVLDESSITGVQVQQHERHDNERTLLVDSQSSPVCDAANIDISDLNAESNISLLQQVAHVDEQVVNDEEELVRNSNKSCPCPTHPLRNNTVHDDDSRKDFDFKRPEVVSRAVEITTVCLAEEEECDLEESRFILSDSIDYTFSEHEMEEEDVSSESDNEMVNPKERDNSSNLTLEERTPADCEEKDVSSESDCNKVDPRESKNGESSADITAEERTLAGCKENLLDSDKVHLKGSIHGVGKDGGKVTFTAYEVNTVQTSENLCSGELLIGRNAAHTDSPDHGEDTQTVQVSEDDASLFTNKGEKTHVLISESESKEKEIVPGISPKKVIRSSFMLTDSLDYTVEESETELESGMEVNQEDTKEKLEDTNVKNDKDKVEDVDLILIGNVQMMEDKEVVENISEKDNEHIGEDLDVNDEVPSQDLDLMTYEINMEELNHTGPIPNIESTREDLEPSIRESDIPKTQVSVISIESTSLHPLDRPTGKNAHENSQAGDMDKESRVRSEHSFISCPQTLEQQQSEEGEEGTETLSSGSDCDKETEMCVEDNVEDSENKRTGKYNIGNQQEVREDAHEDKLPETMGNRKSLIISEAFQYPITESEKDEGKESDLKAQELEEEFSVSNFEALEDVDLISNTQSLEVQKLSTNSVALEDKNPSTISETLRNDSGMKNEEPISDSRDEPIPKYNALEYKEKAYHEVALEDKVVLKATEPRAKSKASGGETMQDEEPISVSRAFEDEMPSCSGAFINDMTLKPPPESEESIDTAFEPSRKTMGGETLENQESTSGSEITQDEVQISICRVFEDEKPSSNSEALLDDVTIKQISDDVELVDLGLVLSTEGVGGETLEEKESTSGSEIMRDEPISKERAFEDERPSLNSEALEVGKPIIDCEAMKIGMPVSNIDAIENTDWTEEPESFAVGDNVKGKEPVLDSGALKTEESISNKTLMKVEKQISNDDVLEEEKSRPSSEASEVIDPTSIIEALEENEQIFNEVSKVEMLISRNEDEDSITNKETLDEAESISNSEGLGKGASESNNEEVQEESPKANGEVFIGKSPISSRDAFETEILVDKNPSSERETLEEVSLPKCDALEGEMTFVGAREQISSSMEMVEKDSSSDTEVPEELIDKLNSVDHVLENENVRSEIGVLTESESELGPTTTEAKKFKQSNEQQTLTDSNQNSHGDKIESESKLNKEVNKDIEMCPVAQNNEVAGLKNKESDQTCSLEESDTVLTFSSSSSFTPSDLICTFDLGANDEIDVVGISQNDKYRSQQTSLDTLSCETSIMDKVSSDNDAIQTKSKEELTELQGIDEINGGDLSQQADSGSEKTSTGIIKITSDTKSREKDFHQHSISDSDGVSDCQMADHHEGPGFIDSSTTSRNLIEADSCSADKVEMQATTLPLESLNRQKRKREEIISFDDCDLPKRKKQLLSEEELEPVKNIVSIFFKIREYYERQKDVDKKDVRKHLLGNLVRHFFKKHPTKGLVEEMKCNATSVVTITDLQKTSHKSSTVVCDYDSNNNSQSMQSDTDMSADTVDGGSKISYNASEKGDSQEDIMEVLSLSQESSSALTSSQPDSIPIYQASEKPGCGIVVNMGQWKKPEKCGSEESLKDMAVCDVQTQVNSLDIDVETTVLGSQSHLMDYQPLENECEDSDQTCLDEESANPDHLDIESVNSKVRERSSSNESDTSQRSELLLEQVSLPVVDMDDEGRSRGTNKERKSFSYEENLEEKQPVEEDRNQNSGKLGSPHSLHSTTSIDYTVEYCQGFVDSSNDIQHSFTDHQSDSDTTLLQSGQDSAVDDAEDKNQTDPSEDITKSNTDSSSNQRESSENVGSQSSELDSEGVEILSTKSTSESELEVLYGPSFGTPCQVKGSLKTQQEIKSESPRNKNSLILKEEKEDAMSENNSSDLKKSFNQSSLLKTARTDPETVLVCSPEDDKDLSDDASTTLVSEPSDTNNNERSNTKKYFKSRLPRFESDSDIEIVDTKPCLPLKSADDFHISLTDSSSDDLPEVFFLREEKATATQSALCNKVPDIKEEPVTPSKTPDLSKAVSRHDLTPSKQGDNSSPRKVCRKRLSLRRTPVKKQKESKPFPLARHTRTPKKPSDKRQKSKSMFIDSDIEIVSGSESEEDFTPSRLKRIKQEVDTDSHSDSEAKKGGREYKTKKSLDEASENIPKKKDKQLEGDSYDEEQQGRDWPTESTHLPGNQGGNRENTPDLEDNEKMGGPCEEESGIKRIYPLLKQSSVESTGAGSLSDIFQLEDSEHTQQGESRENQDGENEQTVFPGREKSKQAEDSTAQDEEFLYTVNAMSNPEKDSERSEGDCEETGQGEQSLINGTVKDSEKSESVPKETAQGELDSEEENNENMPTETMNDESEPLEGDQDVDDFVNNTCPEDNEDEDIYGFPPVLSPFYSQALSPVVPVTTSENAEPNTTPNITEKTDSPNKNLQTPTKPILQMEFDSDSEFSAPEVNFDALDSPEINVNDADGFNKGYEGENSSNQTDQNMEKAEDDKGKGDVEMYEDLPDINRKRKSQDASVNLESKKQKMSAGKDNSTQRKDLHTETRSLDMASSQNASATKESPSLSRVKQLMQKLKAKKSEGHLTDRSPDQSRCLGMASSKETPGDTPRTSHVQRRLLPALNTPYQRTLDYLKRCKEILQTLKTEFSQSESLAGNPRIIQWKKEVSELETRMSLSKTVIAVVGDTGAGKSSLMNALLDQLDILPTSGMRACTAVVVEVVNNTANSKYEADITFLSREEWHTELKLLLRDLTDVHGNIKKGTPDLKSEAGVAFLKIKAVYGKVDRFEALCRQTCVTRWLDKVKTISHSEPTHFRNGIDKYIETADPGVGNQYWPIVKKVTVRLPNCDACSSGAVLVDLPGVRDSNAARDKIARDHLKNCTAVWVVSSIHRAIDDKTAKDLLGENFRRQLLMDGQYGNIAFICTKTDDIKNSEIIRGLHLEEKVRPMEAEINRLEMEKNDLEISKRNNEKCIKRVKKESVELKQNIQEMEECLLTAEGCEESEEIKEMQLLLQEKQEALRKNNENLQTYRQAMDEEERKSLHHGMTITQRRKELSSLCAKARNDYSKKEIKKDFKAGLREMKRKAGNVSNTEELEDDDLYNSDEDDEDIGSSAENLKVFCVSATEYQKMRNIILDDGPPTVFGTEEETQIPALRSYIHQMTEVRHRSSLERILQRVAQFVFDIQNYLTEDGTVQTKGERLKSRSAIEERAFTLKQKLESVIAQLQDDIKGAISNQIKPKLGEGITAASDRANEQTAKWSAPVDKENKQAGGLHWCTYRATVRRQGVFSSPTYGQVNFNEDLTAPMYTSISIVWDKVFSGILWGYFEKFKAAVLNVLRQFVANLCQELHTHGVQSSSTKRVQLYLLDTANQKLTETVTQLKEYVTERQRDASRVLTPVIQENLTPAYDYCAVQSGSGTYARIKQAMAEGVDKGRLYMFDDASRRLLQELEQIQTKVVDEARDACTSICTTLKTAFEPLWEAPGTFLHLRDNLLPSITEISLKLQNIMEEANVRAPVLTTVPPAANSDSDQSAAQARSSQLQRPQEIQRNDPSELPQHSSPELALLSSIKSELGGTRQPLAASAIKREPQDSSSSSLYMEFPLVKSEPTSRLKICCFCGYHGMNSVQCERCLVTRQTSEGMVYRKCNFCKQIGTGTLICEKCKRCSHCGSYVLPPNFVCQQCKSNVPSASRDGSNGNTLHPTNAHLSNGSTTRSTPTTALDLEASVRLKRLADTINLPKRPAKVYRISETVQQEGSCDTFQQKGGSIIGQQTGSPQTAQHKGDLVKDPQNGSCPTLLPGSSSLKVQQGKSFPTMQQVGSQQRNLGQQSKSQILYDGHGGTPYCQARDLSTRGRQQQSQILYDRRSSTPYSQAKGLSSGERDRKGNLQPPSRVPKNFGFKDVCKEN